MNSRPTTVQVLYRYDNIFLIVWLLLCNDSFLAVWLDFSDACRVVRCQILKIETFIYFFEGHFYALNVLLLWDVPTVQNNPTTIKYSLDSKINLNLTHRWKLRFFWTWQQWDWNVHLPRSKPKETANLEPHHWITLYDNVDKKLLTMQLHTQEHTHRHAHIRRANTRGPLGL